MPAPKKDGRRNIPGREPLPESEKQGPYQPTGRPRGRPPLPESQKKAPREPSGRPRGRPKKE